MDQEAQEDTAAKNAPEEWELPTSDLHSEERVSPRTDPVVWSGKVSGSGRKSGYHLEVETLPSYIVMLAKDDKDRYGIPYRVMDMNVIVMGVMPHSLADGWNSVCEASSSICAGDTIISANDKTDARGIVEELLSAPTLHMNMQKTGPRWHIIGDGAKPRVDRDGSQTYSQTDSWAGGATGVPKRSIGEDDSNTNSQPLSLRGWLYLLAAVFVPNLMLLFMWSAVGIGIQVFTFFSPASMNLYGNGIVFLGSLMAVSLIVLDWTKWKSPTRKGFAIIFTTYFICLGAVLKCRFYPFAPLVIVVFHMPIFLGIAKAKILKRVKRRSFYIGVTTSAFLCAILMTGTYFTWMNIDAFGGANQWNDATKARLAMDSKEMYDNWDITINGRTRTLNYFWDCSPKHKQNFDYEKISTFRYMDGDYTTTNYFIDGDESQLRNGACARVKTIWFLTYTTPMIALMLDFIVGLFCLFNGVLINLQDTSKLEKVLKQFILMISFLVFTMYVSSSVAGASMRLTGVIMAFCASGLVALCVWLYMEVGRSALTSQVRNSKLMQSIIALATSDWCRACVLIGANVLIPLFLGINMVNQWVRKKRRIAGPDEPKYTAATYGILMATQNWNWASILLKANWLVILYWTISVGVAKLTYVFLSWLNEELLKVSFLGVVIIFFAIGFIMFMLPPVPGIPVYICSGIVISARARNIDEVGNFWGGMCIAVIESLVLKICAVCGQYTIGFYMGKSVKVQQMIAVDKVFTRAIERILDTRGFNLPKVSVLVGGPDWPTSVLCGILKLNLPQCCIGTLPVIFVSAPCVVAGAFLSNPGAETSERRLAELSTTTSAPVSQEGDTWKTLSTPALGISFLFQLASLVLALYYIQEVVGKHSEELNRPRPEHEAVAALTRREAAYVAEYHTTLNWLTLLKSRKRLILAATCCMLLSTFMFVMMDEACFRPFQVSSRISDPFDKDGLDGNVFNLMLPTGWFATCCFFSACTLHFAFLRWAGTEARKRLADSLEARLPLQDDDDIATALHATGSYEGRHSSKSSR